MIITNNSCGRSNKDLAILILCSAPSGCGIRFGAAEDRDAKKVQEDARDPKDKDKNYSR